MKRVDQQVNFIGTIDWEDPLFDCFDDSVLNLVLRVMGAGEIPESIRDDLKETHETRR